MHPIPSILKTLAYFDLFHYPLLLDEISLFLDHSQEENILAKTLASLKKRGVLFEQDGFFSLRNDPMLIARRKEGNKRAMALLQTAGRIGKFLYQFPFVRAVGISGSLSKNFADQDADIDFFIITDRNRLWIARTLMHLFKKLSFITRRQHWFCMNYYISAEALVIGEKNIFTATEVVTLIPVCGNACFDQFFRANNWTETFYPNLYERRRTAAMEGKDTWIKQAFEKTMGNRLGDLLDNYWMSVTTKRWLKKATRHQMNTKGDPMGLKTSKQFARPDPEHFQKKILGRYTQKLEDLEKKWNIPFSEKSQPHFLLSEII